MNRNTPYGVYGYRFFDTLNLNSSFYQLFAVGCQKITDHAYDWDGLKRMDGPLLLFQYTLSGYGHIEIGDKLHTVGPGYAFMVDIPGKHRYYLPHTSESWEFCFIMFRPANIAGLWSELIQRLGPIPKISAESSAIRYLLDVVHDAGKNRILDGYRASSIVYQFVMELYRCTAAYKEDKEAWPVKIRQAADLMETEYDRLQSLEEIARSVGLSKYHFTRLFSKTTGYTPIDYLTKIRMEKAVGLLRGTELSIEEIARKIGYASGSYFIKVFRHWVGFPPGEFRLGRGIAPVQQS